MRLKDYIKLIYEARKPSQNVQAAMDLSDEELVKYLEELFPNISAITSSQPGLYQYLTKNRKEVLNTLKSKKAKGIEYYKEIISGFETLADLKKEYPSLYATLYSRYGKDTANELLSGLKRGVRGQKAKEPETQVSAPEKDSKNENPYLKLQDLKSFVKNFSSYQEFLNKNAKILLDLRQQIDAEEFSNFLNDIEKKFIELQPLSLEKVKNLVSKYEFLGDFRKENPKLFNDIKRNFSPSQIKDIYSNLKKGASNIKREKFDLAKAREIISNFSDLETFSTQRSDVAQNIRKYFGSNGFYELTKNLERRKKVSDPKVSLPLADVKNLFKKYNTWEELQSKEKDIFDLGLKIYGITGFKTLFNQMKGIKEPVKVSTPTISKGSIGKIATSKIREFLEKFPTKETLKNKRPEVYEILDELGVINSYFGK